ncbi:hypothetical protein BO78DRAFT_92287 [Aspergillus sclerotiicarbonarius CBS 121057]|uniref:Uncharacterized protein n=1 Tax=Aspergillus sclerotiicarbonarius (strain CBS 121057 / IBT 28362) TaxID=1448318 RepID=A0A319FIS7_ASPSB|nr:hypothetical protein BO78DRAFT_92287 [Aspergillus sclerotiicarbonarius CBS 121057]
MAGMACHEATEEKKKKVASEGWPGTRRGREVNSRKGSRERDRGGGIGASRKGYRSARPPGYNTKPSGPQTQSEKGTKETKASITQEPQESKAGRTIATTAPSGSRGRFSLVHPIWRARRPRPILRQPSLDGARESVKGRTEKRGTRDGRGERSGQKVGIRIALS